MKWMFFTYIISISLMLVVLEFPVVRLELDVFLLPNICECFNVHT